MSVAPTVLYIPISGVGNFQFLYDNMEQNRRYNLFFALSRDLHHIPHKIYIC